MKTKQRLPELDDLRGLSIIVMILIHTNAYFLSNKWAASTREISQFAVVAFLFCSSYLSLLKPYPNTVMDIFSYIIKRLKRLVIPFYVFFTVYTLFSIFALGKHFSQSYIVKSFLLTGGIDFNWLVLLFIQIMIVTPLIQFLHEKHKSLLFVYTFAAIVSSIYFLKFTPLPSYRLFMWLPWSLVVVYTLYFNQIWNNAVRFAWTTLLFGIVFLYTQQSILVPLHRSLSMYDNKYPPNLYHISYSLFAINIIYFLAKKKLFASNIVQGTIHFFSTNSYSLFFIHIIVIDAVWKWMRPNNWILFLLIVSYVSVLVQIIMNKASERLRPSEYK